MRQLHRCWCACWAVTCGCAAPVAPVTLADLEVLCGLGEPQPSELHAVVGAEAVHKFWKASQGVRVKTIKARKGPALDSPVVFELATGSTIGQAAPCQLAGGILRLPIFDAFSTNLSVLAVGWVTLSAERQGGPRFFDALAPAIDDQLARASREVARAACDREEPGSLCRAVGGSGVLDIDATLWDQLTIHPADGTLWLVATFTPWCVPCAVVLGKWHQLAVKTLGSRVRLAVVNCHAQQSFCDGLDLPGHPMVAARYGGSDPLVHEAIRSWYARKEKTAFDPPATWRHIGFARAASVENIMMALINALPDDLTASAI